MALYVRINNKGASLKRKNGIKGIHPYIQYKFSTSFFDTLSCLFFGVELHFVFNFRTSIYMY